jgi:anti-sigma B factor antagonist
MVEQAKARSPMSFFYIEDEVALEGWEDAVLVVAGGEIDLYAAPRLRQRIVSHIDAGKRRLIVDLSAVTFIDSTAIGVLVGAMVQLKRSHEDAMLAVFARHNRRVERTFELAGVENVIDLYDTREAAVSALAGVG